MVLILDLQMILTNPLKVAIVTHYNLGWNAVEVSILRCLNYSVPILLTVPLDRSLSKLIGSFDPSLLLHAIVVSSIVDLNNLQV